MLRLCLFVVENMTRNEKRLLSALKDMVESYDVSIDYFSGKNKYIAGNLEGFFIGMRLKKTRELLEELDK